MCAAKRSSGQGYVRDPSLFEKVINKLTLADILKLPRSKLRLPDKSFEPRIAVMETTQRMLFWLQKKKGETLSPRDLRGD